MTGDSTSSGHTLCLVGGGHAHIQLIAATRPLDTSARRVLVSDGAIAVYSGMLPAAVAGLLDPSDAEVDLRWLCSKFGWEFINARVTEISSRTQTITAFPHGSSGDDPMAIKYSVLSVDVGSTSAPLQELPSESSDGGSAAVVSTRPIGMLIPRLRVFEAARAVSPKRNEPLRVCVVGAGKAGVELALALEARFRKTIPTAADVCVTLVSGEAELSKPLGRAARMVQGVLQERRIDMKLGRKSVGLRGGSVVLEGGGEVETDLVMVATGAASHKWLDTGTDLETDAAGFIVVDSTLRAVGVRNVFAAGDCASMRGHTLPKAGVYAVRQGPILEANIRTLLGQSPNSLTAESPTTVALQAYEPQKSALALLFLGDDSRKAIGTKGRLVVMGHWVFNLKMYLDKGWQARFQPAKKSSSKSGGDEQEFLDFASEGDEIFAGSPSEGAALLFDPESAFSDAFAQQHAVLRRMDKDLSFAEQVLKARD